MVVRRAVGKLSGRMVFLAEANRGAIIGKDHKDMFCISLFNDSIPKNACFTFPFHDVIANGVIIDQERVLGD